LRADDVVNAPREQRSAALPAEIGAAITGSHEEIRTLLLDREVAHAIGEDGPRLSLIARSGRLADLPAVDVILHLPDAAAPLFVSGDPAVHRDAYQSRPHVLDVVAEDLRELRDDRQLALNVAFADDAQASGLEVDVIETQRRQLLDA